MTLPSYEKLGVFYLGREYDPKSQALGDELLYDSRDLTTHAVCIGMTGSGKTGLCLSLLEEAAIDGVPAIAIDPKGDIGNLLLTFPDLKAADFQPWVDTGEASRKGQSVEDFASATAETWRKGLAEWNQDGARIQRLRDAAEVAIYTPGSNSGPAAVDPALFRRAGRSHLERRHRTQGTHRLGGRRPARTARHRCGPDQEPRAHPALGDPRHRVAQGPEPRPRRDHPGRAEAPVRQGGRVRRRELLPGEGADGTRAAGEWPDRGAGLRSLARGRSRSTSRSCSIPTRASHASRSSRSRT